MAYERKDLSGAVFKNKKKEKDTHPDRTGDCLIDGKEYWISGWIKQDRNGEQFMSLAFKPKDAQTKPAPKPAARVARPMTLSETLDDEVPF